MHWEVLPPPVIDWGDVPAQHPELNFCVQIGDRFYLSLGCRYYYDSHGYSLFTLVGDSPRGPFTPDLAAFRLTGTSRRNVTWLGHPINHPDGLLLGLWLSHHQVHDLPSDNFTVGPLKRLVVADGHLRLRYWKGNDRARGEALALDLTALTMVHPGPSIQCETASMQITGGRVALRSSREGMIVLLPVTLAARRGFFWEGLLTLHECRGHFATHQPPAAAGFFLETGPGTGTALLAETGGVTRIGTLRFAEAMIEPKDPYEHSGAGLAAGRLGEHRGLISFAVEDTVGPFGHAAFAGLRHGRSHHLRVMAREPYFEVYVDDWYVQSWIFPEHFTGRLGLMVTAGTATWEDLHLWSLAEVGAIA